MILAFVEVVEIRKMSLIEIDCFFPIADAIKKHSTPNISEQQGCGLVL